VRVEGTSLNPRTKINYTPYAIRATNAQQANLAFDLNAPWVSVDTGIIISATSTGATAITGRSSNTIGTNPGVYGRTDSGSSNAAGVFGEVTDTTPGGFSAGVRGENNGTGFNGVGLYGSHAGFGYGVYGTVPGGVGVFGSTNNGFGLWGQSTSNIGAYARTTSGDAALQAEHADEDTEAFLATDQYAVEAYNDMTDGAGTAIYGSGGRTGIYGESTNSGFGPSLTRTGVQGLAGGFSTGADTFYGVHGFGQAPASG
jgi:hypothetical protein